MFGSQWPEPELSLGSSFGVVDAQGKQKCWAVKEDSPAHNAWEAISRPVIHLLQDQSERLDAKDSDVMVEIFMIGESERRANPTILFSCQSRVIRQRAMELVDESLILKGHPGINLAACSRQRRPLAIEEATEATLPPGVYATEPLRHCGVSVLVSGEHRGLPRRATLGGIVYIAGLFYGIITLYACKQAALTAIDENTDPRFEFYGQESDDFSDGRHDSAAVLSLDNLSVNLTPSPVTSTRKSSTRSSLRTTEGDRSSSSTSFHSQVASPMSKEISATMPGLTSPDSRRNYFANPTDDDISPELGNIFVSAPEKSLDWALVEIENFDLMLENISLNNRRFMTNSIYWQSSNFHTEAIHPKGLSHRPTDVDVLICTGNRDDALEGRLYSTRIFQKTPQSNTFQELWLVRSLNGSFFDGDCGSWVVDCETGKLCGIVVTGFPGTDTAYIVPAIHVFDNMQSHLGKKVELSTPELWAFREEDSRSRQTISIIPPTPQPGLHRSDSAKTLRDQNSMRISVEEDPSTRRRSWSQNSIQSTVFDTRSLHSTASSSHWSRIPTYLAGDAYLAVHQNQDRLVGAAGSARNRTGSIRSGTSTPYRHSYRPYSTTSTLQSIDSGYGNPPCNNLYVRNLPSDPSESDLRDFFSAMPGFEGLRFKLHEPECFVQFADVISATSALYQADDHRFSADDKWGIMVGFARNGVEPARSIPSQEEIELEISLAELLGADTLPTMREAGGKIARLISPKRGPIAKQPVAPERTLPGVKQVTDKSAMLQEMFAEFGSKKDKSSDKMLVIDSDSDEG